MRATEPLPTAPIDPDMSALERARELARDRHWPELAGMADSLASDEIARSPELEYLLGDALRRVGRTREALVLACEAERGAARSADPRLVLRSINLMGMLKYESGSLEDAESDFERLLERAAETRDDEFAARASNNLGVLANIRGRRELALTSYHRALAAYQRLGHARGLAQTHYNLGISYRDLGFPEDAEQHYATAIRYAEEAESEDVVALAETERSFLCVRVGDGELAEAIATRALGRLRAMEDPAGSANAIRVLALAAEIRGNLDLALSRLDDSLSIIEKHPDLLLLAELQRDRGRVLTARGDVSRAVQALEVSRDAYGRLGALDEVEVTAALLGAARGTGAR